MAGPRPTPSLSDERVAAAKARLVALADDARPERALVVRASRLMRERPWQGVGLALVAGVLLGAAPGRTVRCAARFAWPVIGTILELAPVVRFGVRGGRSFRTPSPAGRSR